MYPVSLVIEREHLFREILDVLRQWPELDRRIFSQAHYEGRSLEAISHSLQLDENEVSAILTHCECRLRASLGSFRNGDSGKTSRTAA